MGDAALDVFESFLNGGERGGKRSQIDPPSKSADFESNFTDAKFKVRAVGQGKEEEEEEHVLQFKEGKRIHHYG